MAFRRGFKTEANSLALEVRSELRLGALDRLDPFILAEHLAIPVIALSDLATTSRAAGHLLNVDPGAFSAVTVFRGSMRTILHNDGHSDGRISSNITHEAEHGLLQHRPTPALDDRGCRLWDQDVEDEAQFLSGALLVPEDAALAIARGRFTKPAAAAHFGVSEKMIQYRLNVTGAVGRVERARRAGTGYKLH
ncbi:ImmA/IrrE family metallo-endopeptidase [Streptomyces cellulosae]|uniref:ImmA/IrrE family metallo-endopeptidase n=1 Tax=unclassified Streptomyces TaxID=2593676 RepID=UPI00109E45B9|nr:ImmA/IrrE family metallo-endopeptidase [Streptomyces sp. SID4956]THC47059.1 ImmA/IrrE family metallo-endopeptidase [Streptomyces sp. Akac8]WSB91021.1 ImmA/IrrE family metallo-endopeptidase [Streptomyces cellulosae]